MDREGGMWHFRLACDRGSLGSHEGYLRWCGFGRDNGSARPGSHACFDRSENRVGLTAVEKNIGLLAQRARLGDGRRTGIVFQTPRTVAALDVRVIVAGACSWAVVDKDANELVHDGWRRRRSALRRCRGTIRRTNHVRGYVEGGRITNVAAVFSVAVEALEVNSEGVWGGADGKTLGCDDFLAARFAMVHVVSVELVWCGEAVEGALEGGGCTYAEV
jgi:hypothetical protein